MRLFMASLLACVLISPLYAAESQPAKPIKVAKKDKAYKECMNKEFEAYMNNNQDKLLKRLLNGEDEASVKKDVDAAEEAAQKRCDSKS